MSYFKDLVTDILPYISKKIPMLSPEAQDALWELTNTYVKESQHGDKAYDIVNDLKAKMADVTLLYSEEKTESEEHVYALFVLASVYFLGYYGLIKQSDITVENSGKLGFEGSVELFYETLEVHGLLEEMTEQAPAEVEYSEEEDEYSEDEYVEEEDYSEDDEDDYSEEEDEDEDDYSDEGDYSEEAEDEYSEDDYEEECYEEEDE